MRDPFAPSPNGSPEPLAGTPAQASDDPSPAAPPAATPTLSPAPAPSFPFEALARPRVGKVARLPGATREQLNRRLLAGEPAKQLVQWLNRQPEVQAVLRTLFGGSPISEVNLSHWKTGGFRAWLLEQQTHHHLNAADGLARDLPPASARPLAEQIVARLLSGCLLDLRPVAKPDPSDPREFTRLRRIVGLLNQLRQADAQAAQLHLLRHQLGLAHDRLRYLAAKLRSNRPLLTPAAQGQIRATSNPQHQPAPQPANRPAPTTGPAPGSQLQPIKPIAAD